MKKMVLTALFTGVLSLEVRAELGMSEEQCKSLYGEPSEQSKDFMECSEGDFEIQMLFKDGKCYTVRFRYFPKAGAPHEPIPVESITKLLEKAKPGAEWGEPKKADGRTTWECKSNPKIGALYGESTKALYIALN